MFHVKHDDSWPRDVSRETRERLDVYVALLLKWTERINLIARGDRAHVWERHVADSLQLAAFIPEGVSGATDLGSGGGFPGLVLAIATGLAFDLVEADQRKAAFLREAARATGCHVRVRAARLETVALAPARLVTARALAPLPKLLNLAERFLTADGLLLLPKGAGLAEELTQAQSEWQMRVERHASRTEKAASILLISKLRRVRHDG